MNKISRKVKKSMRRKNNDSEEEDEDGVNRILSTKVKQYIARKKKNDKIKECKTKVEG